MEVIKKEAWLAFKEVAKKFLWNNEYPEFKWIVENVLTTCYSIVYLLRRCINGEEVFYACLLYTSRCV